MARWQFNRTDAILALALVAQLGGFLTWYSLKHQRNERATIQIPDRGDWLDSLKLAEMKGVLPLRSVGDSSTLLISLRSTCRWCTESMPQLKESLAEISGKIRVVVVTNEPLDSAITYAKLHGIEYPVVSLDASVRGSTEHLVTARTPWAFYIEPDGRVRFSSHVSDLHELMEVVK